MTARRSTPLAATLLIVAGLLAGCGGGSSGSTTTITTTPAAATGNPTTTATSTPTTTAPGPSTGASSPTTNPSAASVAQYVKVCRSIVQHEPKLPANVKAKVEGICDKAANGDVAGARAAAREVCVEVINASPIPLAAIKQRAIAACKASH